MFGLITLPKQQCDKRRRLQAVNPCAISDYWKCFILITKLLEVDRIERLMSLFLNSPKVKLYITVMRIWRHTHTHTHTSHFNQSLQDAFSQHFTVSHSLQLWGVFHRLLTSSVVTNRVQLNSRSIAFTIAQSQTT